MTFNFWATQDARSIRCRRGRSVFRSTAVDALLGSLVYNFLPGSVVELVDGSGVVTGTVKPEGLGPFKIEPVAAFNYGYTIQEAA